CPSRACEGRGQAGHLLGGPPGGPGLLTDRAPLQPRLAARRGLSGRLLPAPDRGRERCARPRGRDCPRLAGLLWSAMERPSPRFTRPDSPRLRRRPPPSFCPACRQARSCTGCAFIAPRRCWARFAPPDSRRALFPAATPEYPCRVVWSHTLRASAEIAPH